MEVQKTGEEKKILNKKKGFFNPKSVKTFSFYTITLCVVASVLVSILAIWDVAKTDIFWRMISTFAVIAVGSAVFSFVNNVFGSDE